MRVAITLVVPLIITGVMVFSIVDIITIASDRVRHLPRLGWVLLVVFLSFVGSLLWFLLGREPDPSRPRARRAAPRGPVAPDDDPEFLSRLRREREQEERIRQLEQRLAELDDDPPE